MIIVNNHSSADYSANSIGHITLAYDEDADTILSYYSKSLTNEQLTAFNTFIVGLKNVGVFEKLDYLVLPFLAANQTEALKNALSGSSAFGDNTSAITFSNGAIGVTAGESYASILASGINLSDFGFHCYIVSDEYWTTPTAASVPILGRSYTSSNVLSNFYLYQSGTYMGYFNSLYGGKQVNHGVFSSPKKFASLNIDGTDVYMQEGANTGTATLSQSLNQSMSKFKFGVYNEDTYTDTAQQQYSRQTFGMIALGSSLTEEECVAFKSAFETLASAFYA